jgi:S-adenosylmethionine/arginine decarboxylase-like enzyme
MKRDKNYIGTHLVMDITSWDRELLRDEGKVNQYLTELIRLADMTCLVAPQTFKFPFDNEYKKFLEKLRKEGTTSPLIEEKLKMLDYNENEGSGVTGIAVLSESHAAIHTFPEKEDPFMSVCLYSCKWFDANDIITYSNLYWKVKENHYVIMDRHIGEPQSIIQDHVSLTPEYSTHLG